jgi:predicted MPP superfamily phosphohydrolase
MILYIAINAYLFIRGINALPKGCPRRVFATVFSICVLSLPAGMLLNKLPSPVVSALQYTGTGWLFALFYFVAFLAIIDLARLANRLFHCLPSFLTANPPLVRLWLFGAAIVVVAGIFTVSIVRFYHPQTVKLNLTTGKHVGDSLKIVLASDLHLGYTVGKRTLERFVRLINSQKPDMVLLCGDVFDRSVRPVIEYRMTEQLRQIKAPLGVFAVTGNHEYLGELQQSLSLLAEAGITVLRDSVAMPTDNICIVGRDDYYNKNRKPLHELLAGIDTTRLLIVLDHQPCNLEEAQQANVDFQFSGHTHDGQLFPMNLILRMIYEKSYGCLRKGNTQYYVTSGLGLWGAPVRIGSHSETVNISLYESNSKTGKD